MDRDAYVASLPSERGWMLPLVLVSTVILASLSWLLTAKTGTLGALYRDEIKSGALHEALRSDIISLNPRPTGCLRRTPSSRATRGTWWVCFEKDPSFTTIPSLSIRFPRPDFEGLLSNPTPCSGLRQEIRNQRFTSPVAPRTCTLKEDRLFELRVMDNIIMNSTFIEQRRDTPVPAVVSPGYLEVHGSLRTSSDLLLVMGGDVRIDHLQGVGQVPVRVTIISSRGDIEVERVSGPISLLVAGRAALRVPPTPFLPPFPLPPERMTALLGLESVHDGRR